MGADEARQGASQLANRRRGTRQNGPEANERHRAVGNHLGTDTRGDLRRSSLALTGANAQTIPGSPHPGPLK